MSTSASVFENVGIAQVRSGSGGNSLFSIDGTSEFSAFGVLQGIEVSEKVSAQTRRTLRNEPIMFPAGDEFAEISVSFMTPLTVLCGNVSTWSGAVKLYSQKRVRAGAVNPVSISAAGQGYTGFITGLRLSGAIVNGLPVVTVSLSMIGRNSSVGA